MLVTFNRGPDGAAAKAYPVGQTKVSSIAIEDYDPLRHPNPMMFVDNLQAERRAHGGNLEPYRVCVVRVAAFEFIFHSTTQLELCLEYYRCKTTGRLSAGSSACRADFEPSQLATKLSARWNAHSESTPLNPAR